MNINRIKMIESFMCVISDEYVSGGDISKESIKEYLLRVNALKLKNVDDFRLNFSNLKVPNVFPTEMKCIVNKDDEKKVDVIQIYNKNSKKSVDDIINDSTYELIINPKLGMAYDVSNILSKYMMEEEIEGTIMIDFYYKNLGLKIYLNNEIDFLKIQKKIESFEVIKFLNQPNPVLPTISYVNVVTGKLKDIYFDIFAELLSLYIFNKCLYNADENDFTIDDFYFFIGELTELKHDETKTEVYSEMYDQIGQLFINRKMEKILTKYLNKR